MNILVTGSKGFVGKNLIATLKLNPIYEINTFDRHNTHEELETLIKKADFIVHLAGVNRPNNIKEFFEGNSDLTELICNILVSNNLETPILLSSSIQATKENSYGKSKLLAEKKLLNLKEQNGNQIFIYRLANLFGKWSRPFYNSVVATWCYQAANGLELSIDDENRIVELIYIDDFIDEIINCINGDNIGSDYYTVPFCHEILLRDLSEIILSFKEIQNELFIPNMNNKLVRNLYSTYLTYLNPIDFKYPLREYRDERGSFTEFIKSDYAGQVSINKSNEKVIKGDHWHHSKHEKFLVVSGFAEIKLRNIFSNEIISIRVSENKLEVVDIPPGFTHNIMNTGNTELVTVMWVNEVFDEDNADTFALKV